MSLQDIVITLSESNDSNASIVDFAALMILYALSLYDAYVLSDCFEHLCYLFLRKSSSPQSQDFDLPGR